MLGRRMPTLLVVHHTASPSLHSMFEAVMTKLGNEDSLTANMTGMAKAMAKEIVATARARFAHREYSTRNIDA